MTKLTDKQLNELLGGLDTMPVLEDTKVKEEDEFYSDEQTYRLPLITSSLYKSKGTVKGAKLEGSPYEVMGTLMSKIADGFTEKPINEFKNGLSVEAAALVAYGKENGVVYTLPSFSQAGDRIKARIHQNKLSDETQLDFNPDCPVEILTKYRQDIHAASQALDELRDTLFATYEKGGGNVFLDKKKVSTDWLLKHISADRELINEAARLEAHKDSLTSMYTSYADKFSQGEQSFAPAVLVAELYLRNMAEQNRRRQEAGRSERERLINEYKEQFGLEPNDDALEKINQIAREAVENYSDTGYSSIQGLFPLGFIQFLQWIGTGVVTTKRKKETYAYVYLTSDRPLTEKEQLQWKMAEGHRAQFVDGKLGELYISDDNKMDMKETFVTPKAKDIEDKSDGMKDLLLNTKFTRGAKLWIGDRQSGLILHSKVHRSGVTLFLGGFKQD